MEDGLHTLRETRSLPTLDQLNRELDEAVEDGDEHRAREIVWQIEDLYDES